MKLATDLSNLQPAYDVVVVGSGYGGAINAARLAQAGRKVCVLERGKEWPVGSFPDDAEEAAAELRCPEKPLGLYDYHAGDDLDVLVGNGLGGTSLINANVVIEPDDAVWKGPRWPLAIRQAAAQGVLAQYGKRFTDTLGVETLPEAIWPAKVKAMADSATKTGGTFRAVPLAVHFKDNAVDEAGVQHHRCTMCGDCVTGCNVGAKNTMAMTYLPIAARKGASLFTEVEVDHVVAHEDGGAFVYCRGGLPPIFAPVVILAAGSLGSTAILLRSAQRGLRTSWRLGHHFSGNADQLGFSYNGASATNVLGFGAHGDRRAQISVGPTIASLVAFGTGDNRFIIEDGAVPRAFVDALRDFGSVLAEVEGRGARHDVGQLGRAAEDWLGYTTEGAANHSMVYLGMGHDGADGRLVLDAGGAVKVLWTDIEDRPIFQKISAEMDRCAEALGGTFIRNPRWSELLGRNLVTVHPLGGCPMGDDAEHGAVNAFGEVFDGDGHVHRGLFVSDGAVVPTSVGVNPLYTISLLAERTAEHIEHRKDLRPPCAVPIAPRAPTPTLGLQFSERMQGYWMPGDGTDYAKAYEDGRAAGNAIGFDLTMFVEDLTRFLDEPEHEARAEGIVDHGAARGLRVDRGRFNLFVDDPGQNTKRMKYLLRFTDPDGQVRLLDGVKIVKDDPGFDLWADNTTLFTRIHRGGEPTDPVDGIGILRIGVGAFVRLLSTVRVRNGNGAGPSARAIARFGRFFLGDLWETYVTPKLATR